MKATLHTDGGSRGNPGPAGIGFVIVPEGREAITGSEAIGIATNNQAEYRALIEGLVRAGDEKITHLDIFMDSELIVKQIKGEYRVRDAELKPLFGIVMESMRKFKATSIAHVKREKNKWADKLVNEALDK